MNTINKLSDVKTHGDLLSYFKKPRVTPSSIMHEADTISPQYAGFIYEALCRILVGFRILIPNAHLYVGNSNTSHSLNPVVNWRQELLDRPVVSGNTDGFSDISYMSNNAIVLSSSKWINADSSLESYDIDKIYNIGRNYPGHKITMFVKDKKVFNLKYKSAHTKGNRIVNDVYDITDLDSRLNDLLNILTTYDFNFMNIVNKYLSTKKTPLKLKFHQILCKFYLRRCSKEYMTCMIEMKCRGGKSYMMASDILEHSSKCVLILTPIPSETKRMLIKMFNSLIEFDGYEIVELKRGVRIPKSERQVFVASKQYFDKHVNDHQLINLKFDAVYFDEMHFTGLTKKAKLIFNRHVNNNTRTVYLTATGEKVKATLGLSSTQTFQFQLEHEDLCRNGDIDGLNNLYSPEVVSQSLISRYGEGKDYSAELKNEYAKMPKFTHIGITMVSEFLKRINISNNEYSFDIDELFRVEEGNFAHPDNVNEFLTLHFGRSGSGEQSNMKKIKKYGGRIADASFVGTQLWFLPQGKEGGISGVSNCMEKAIINHKGFGKNYNVIKLNGEEMNGPAHNLEERIACAEKKTIEDGKDGLIVLLGSMCNMGVSLPKADIVVMLNNIHEMDRYTQMVMRCMTEDDGKERGFVVDYNQKRLLQFCLSVVNSSGHTEVEHILRRATKIIDIDHDDFITADKTDLVKKLMSIWSNSDINRPQAICSRLENLASDIEITRDDRIRFKEFMKTVSKKKLLDRKDAELFEDGDKVDDASVASSENKSTKSTDSDDEEYEEVPDYALEMTRTLPFFVAVLTARDDDSNFVKLLKKVKNTPHLLDAFEIQCRTWWLCENMDGFIDLVIEVFSRKSSLHFHTEREINSSIKMLKMEMVRMVDNKKPLLELLVSLLEPKSVEIKKFGEVFTPLNFIERMLDSIPSESFKDPSIKWFDPAAGVGNFMVCLYYRLMEGLVVKFPDYKDRQNHIIHNMLYMSEIGAKNVAIIKLIFGDDCNLNFGDTLSLNENEKWGIDMDDVYVIGNPPYNKEFTNAGSSPLYHTFIEKYIDNCKMLLFVVPSRWFAGGKGLDGFRNMMLNRNDIKIINHFEDSKDVFGSSVDIEGGVNYFLMDRDYSGECSMNGKLVDLSMFDIVVDSKYSTLIEKMKNYPSIMSLYEGRRYKVETNDSRFTDNTEFVKCFVSKQKGGVKYIEPSKITVKYDYWKVITARANGKSKKFGNIFVGSPSEIHSASYISFKVNSELEATSLMSFMKTTLANKLLGLRKIAQDINEKTCEWIPLPPLDREWTNEMINDYYKLTSDEIELLN
jgi:hypothetical protein